MFYFMLAPYMTYNVILIAAAVIPAVFLMGRVARLDRLEKESPALLWRLVKAGVFAALLAMVEEWILGGILDLAAEKETTAYRVILYFGVVACAEESSKYLLMKRNSWASPEFNCQYDGVVYAVFVSLGFALWENLSYVMSYGLQTALVRAVTAIPGHACFGVFMGVFYGIARKYANQGRAAQSRRCRILAFCVPAVLHGIYDYIATMESASGTWYFIGFVAALFLISYVLVGRMAKRDRYIA